MSDGGLIVLCWNLCSLFNVIIKVRVVLKRTVAGNGCFDNLSGSYLQSQVNSVSHVIVS